MAFIRNLPKPLSPPKQDSLEAALLRRWIVSEESRKDNGDADGDGVGAFGICIGREEVERAAEEEGREHSKSGGQKEVARDADI